MSIEQSDFENVSAEDIADLVSGQVPEGLRYEFKRETYGKADADKREFLKDIAAFANAGGGHLLLGIEEKNGVAVRTIGLPKTTADDEMLRLQKIADTGLEPRIPGLRLRAIPCTDDDMVIAVRVPKSWSGPHRVIANNSNRFYVRHSSGVHEPDVTELHRLFAMRTNFISEATQFRDERLHAIEHRWITPPLLGSGQLVVHILPAGLSQTSAGIDPEAVFELKDLFRPIGTEGMTPGYSYDGFINRRGGDKNYGYTQVFRHGGLEATKANIVVENDGHRFIRGGLLEEQFFTEFPRYVQGLEKLGVSPPLVVLITLLQVGGVQYLVRVSDWDDPLPNIASPVLFLPPCTIEQFGDDLSYHRAVRPAFDALWNASDFPRDMYFDGDGKWVGKKAIQQ
jgi:hypothetical protein